MHRTEQVWLPELQVWAAKPSLPLPPRSNSSSRPPQPIVLCDSVSPGSSEPSADLEHVAQVVAGRNREVIDVTSPSCSPQPGSSPASALQAPSCPICLSDIQNPLDKAVGLPCLHVFCTPCLGTWTHRHRSCPLCKGTLTSFMHQIRSSTEFKELELGPLPQPDPVARHEPAGQVALLDAYVAAAQSRPASRWGSSAAPSFVLSSSRAARDRRESSRPQEPRPYYWRVQQQAQAGTGRSAPHHPAAPHTPEANGEDPALVQRRHIYAQGLRAISPGQCGGSRRRQGAASKQLRMADFVQRDLRAILRVEDVDLVRMSVLGLLSTDVGGRRAQSPSVSAGVAVQQLQPFLGAHADHFWHEVRCFGASDHSLTTYDRVTLYPSPQQPPAQDGEEELQRMARHTARTCRRAQAVVDRQAGCEAAQSAEEAADRRKRRRFSSHPPGDAEARRGSSIWGAAASPAAAAAAAAVGLSDIRAAQPSSREPLDLAAAPLGDERSPFGPVSPQHAAPSRIQHSYRGDQHHCHHAGSGRRELDRPSHTRRHHADWHPEPAHTGHATHECRQSRDMCRRKGVALPVHALPDFAGWEDRWQMSF